MEPQKLSKYQIQEVLGEGTHGTVRKALNKQNGQLYALKWVKLGMEEVGIPRSVLVEASILKQFPHSNIVKLVETINFENELILVLEYVESDLRKYMKNFKEKGFSLPQIKSFSHQILKTLCFLHQKKILHRDLKPENLLINQKEMIIIADFGLARVSGIPTRGYSNNVVTLYYRSPELLLGESQYANSIDIWSVGCILVELAILRTLFKGKDEVDQLNRIFEILGTPTQNNWPTVSKLPLWGKLKFEHRKPINFSQILPKFPPEGIDLIQKMLQLNPAKRISAEEALKHPFFSNY